MTVHATLHFHDLPHTQMRVHCQHEGRYSFALEDLSGDTHVQTTVYLVGTPAELRDFLRRALEVVDTEFPPADEPERFETLAELAASEPSCVCGHNRLQHDRVGEGACVADACTCSFFVLDVDQPAEVTS